MMVLRPAGLIPERRRRLELSGADGDDGDTVLSVRG
jgi:hypothetical protein